MKQRYRVVRRHRQWDIVAPDLTVVEGGFFSRDAAEASCADWNQNHEHRLLAAMDENMPFRDA